MTDYVLVHGAWHGSWCWKRVRDRLQSAEHRVFTPSLTGLGERSHLLGREVGLDTHVEDLANLLVWEELRDIVLVGHSYGGIVIRQVADRLPDRMRALVYLDAFVPEDGHCLNDYLPDQGQRFRDQAAASGDGWKVPPPPAAYFAVNAADAAWVDGLCTMQPLSSFAAPVRLSGACDGVANIGYVLATGFPGSPFPQFHAAAAERGWWWADLPCGHDIMVDMPAELTALLLERG
ncbi:alpha/beta fold hydrolase [Inquilinus sp. CA228]|uniref:alpha/beta fold hydrolase n=1 Tax=Inquilinus sp. CA228 TaxID=3455609 RepID=UPI003F8CFD81